MKKSGIAAIATAAVLVIGGGTAYALSTNAQEPAPVETTATSTPMPAETASAVPDAQSSPEPEATADYITANDDAGYLAEVEKRTRPGTVLNTFSDAELITFGHEGCKQISEGVPIEDLRLVDGEQPNAAGSWPDTSAVFNSGLLHYCPQLIEDLP